MNDRVREALERVRAWVAWRRHAASDDRYEPYTGSTAALRFDDVNTLLAALDAARRVLDEECPQFGQPTPPPEEDAR